MNLDIKQRLFTYVLYVGMALSILSIIINLFTGFPLRVNIKWAILFLACFFAFILSSRYPSSKPVAFVFSLSFTVIYMPYIFVNSGGGRSDFIALSFLALIFISYILDGPYQGISFAALIAVFIILHILDYVRPDLIPVYDPKSRFYDRLILVPVMLSVSYMIIKVFSKEYKESNKNLFYYANYDMLTGLLNRWGFSESLSKGFNTATRDGYLLLIDIDNFKLINDRYGHATGDEVLRRFGEILKRYFSGSRSLVCRWGGDEFVIMFFDGEEKLDNVTAGVTREFLAYINELEPLVDISIGSAFIEDCSTVEDVLVKSDQLMYNQKNAKR